MRSRHAAVGEHGLVRRRRPRPGRGRSRCGRASRSARCATARSACRPRASASPPASRARRATAARKRCDRRLALGQRPRRPRRLRGARLPPPCARRWRRRRPAISPIGEPSAGLVSLRRRRSWRCGRRAAACRKSSSSGRSSSVPSPRRWNSGCHCTAAMYCGPGLRIASIMPSSGQRASTTKPGARSLMPWWWTLLTVRRADAGEDLAPGGCPGRTRRRAGCGRRARRRGADLARAAACRCPGSSVPPKATFMQLQAAADAEHRLAARRERLQQRHLVLVADAVAAPPRVERLLAVAAGPDVGAALEHQRVEPARRSRRARRRRFCVSPTGPGSCTAMAPRRHHPVRDRLLDVLQRLAGEDRALRIGVEEAGGDARP